MKPLLCLALVPLVVACAKKREPAPAEMQEIASFLFANYEDERAVEDGMANLADWLDVHADTDVASDGWRLEPLSEVELGPIDHPEANLDELIGLAVAGLSPHPIREHAETLVLADQVFSNPRNFEIYDRSIEGDADAFVDGSGRIDTINDVQTSNFGIAVPYTLYKNYSWVELDGTREAIVAQAWIPETGCNDSGENCLVQSFSIDVWYAPTPGATTRFTSTWSQVTSSLDGVIGEDLKVAALAGGMIDVFEYTDAFITDGG